MAMGYKDLFSLLYEIGSRLEHLTQLAEKKRRAVRGDDLTTLDEIMREEQAESLAFRNLDLRREKCLKELGLKSSLSALKGEDCPVEFRAEARRCVDGLMQRYQAYQQAAEGARELLERNLGEIEAVVAQAGLEPDTGAGYRGTRMESPSDRKTDFRA